MLRVRPIAAFLALASYCAAGLFSGWWHVHPAGEPCNHASPAAACIADDHDHGHAHHGHFHHSHVHDHSHSHHGHAHHGHQHDTAMPVQGSGDSSAPAPSHDESQCEICRFLALGILPTLPVADPSPTEVTGETLVASPQLVHLDMPRTHFSRGPPQA